MKKLSEIKLHDAVVLENREMKAIYGGSGGASDSCCAYSTSSSGSSFTCVPYGGAAEAEFMAGPNGWWGCNTAIIKQVCGC